MLLLLCTAAAHTHQQPPRDKGLFVYICVNDPSAGSPTETLLRLLLPLNGKVQSASPRPRNPVDPDCVEAELRGFHRTIQSVGATGGVYKGQGRNQRELMTRAY